MPNEEWFGAGPHAERPLFEMPDSEKKALRIGPGNF